MSGPNDPYDPKLPNALAPETLDAAVAAGRAAFASATDVAAVRDARLAHLSDRAPVAMGRREIGALPPQARADAGKRINDAMATLQAAYDERLAVLEAEHEVSALAAERVDMTLPSARRPVGARHPLTTISERITDVFLAMGYELAEGPEAEHEWFNFDALNMGPDHPARGEADTLYLEPADGGLVLRTHTSPVQIRTLLTRDLPVYVVCPGRTYRNDPLDATHTPVFSQVEGLVVDEGITIAHLKGTLDAFATAMFGAGIVTRLRPSYFPFVEPGAEVDLVCFVCHGASAELGGEPCRTCSSEGWIEWGGCGMVNPLVLRACGVDTDRYTGFAFGMGVDRTLMNRYGLEDIRTLVEGDVRFSAVFGMEG